MSTKHTPGPWHVEEVSRNQRRVSDATGRRICGNVYEANARLIAEAPAMLAALREVTRCLQWHVDNGSGVAMDGKAIIDARAILARIDGGKTNG